MDESARGLSRAARAVALLALVFVAAFLMASTRALPLDSNAGTSIKLSIIEKLFLLLIDSDDGVTSTTRSWQIT